MNFLIALLYREPLKEEENFKMQTKLKTQVKNILKQIPDPELGISLWDLGLIYDIKIKGKQVEILMTLTTIGCPLFSQIETSVKEEVGKLPGVENVLIDLTFEPAWTLEKMSKEARIQLGL